MNRSSFRSFAAVSVSGLCLAASIGAHAAPTTPASLLGDRVSSDEALRTVQITPSTRFVNVDKGDIVKFVSGGQEFAFDFDSAYTAPFNLQRIAPSGALDHPVMVYLNEGGTDLYTQ